ncbi:MAG: protein-export chaperone SecB [Betaproteobacteria bacterium]|nr:protein-export chaperone SecB [Betaproteobacteria bacterium]
MSDQPQAVFNIDKVYVKDLSVEVPGAPGIFLMNESPQLEVQLNQSVQRVGEVLYELTLQATITAKSGDSTMFLVEAHQAGLFTIASMPQDQINALLGVVCPNILFPYLRETISDTTVRAGFPPVILAPVNFEALYQQSAQQQADAGPRIEVAH